jgi:hypothetical protein
LKTPIEAAHSEQHRENGAEKKNEQNLRDLWDFDRRSNIYVLRVPEREEKGGGNKKVCEEVMAE